MTGNDTLRKVNQALRNKIEELKKKLWKVSDDPFKESTWPTRGTGELSPVNEIT